MQTSAVIADHEARERLNTSHLHDPVACAEATRTLMQLARRVAVSDCTVLIAGESGTGKEVLARYIHGNSNRADATFVAINCAAIPENMLEAVLFGWERGAFTGAHSAHAGKFEQAQGGTLLLDEVAEIPLSLQAKLLRVLQEREVERLGGRGSIQLDVRVLAATNRHLREEVAGGRFREDLYYRLNVFPLTVLPLRNRRDDILPLAMRLLTAHCRPGHPIPALHPSAAQMLLTYAWPGNVRELENVMQRALVLCDGDIVRDAHVVFDPAPGATDRMTAAPGQASGRGPAATISEPYVEPDFVNQALAQSLAITEQKIILQALRTHATRERVAERLGISPRTLRYKLARLRQAGVDCGEVMEADEVAEAGGSGR
ncbi:MAG TPA: sigma-54 dependent transcriptional regulator [Steroidobacteraceae bacterium]|jgi:two-component system response regulator FlrC|nr:sigma-54 dependent transcriptional regulator [Steroidobacteraceae bacterium]